MSQAATAAMWALLMASWLVNKGGSSTGGAAVWGGGGAMAGGASGWGRGCCCCCPGCCHWMRCCGCRCWCGGGKGMDAWELKEGSLDGILIPRCWWMKKGWEGENEWQKWKVGVRIENQRTIFKLWDVVGAKAHKEAMWSSLLSWTLKPTCSQQVRVKLASWYMAQADGTESVF